MNISLLLWQLTCVPNTKYKFSNFSIWANSLICNCKATIKIPKFSIAITGTCWDGTLTQVKTASSHNPFQFTIRDNITLNNIFN